MFREVVNTQQKEQCPTPVLRISTSRGGSHAPRLRLNASPDFYSPHPMHVVDFMPLVLSYGYLSADLNRTDCKQLLNC